ncbi:MAG TPA: hypothetical protein DCW29_07630, partial [Janthinobacterium sp.]|nr:hypothetical protein [Janthinobacterium sp.]
ARARASRIDFGEGAHLAAAHGGTHFAGRVIPIWEVSMNGLLVATPNSTEGRGDVSTTAIDEWVERRF